ncbi:MAG: Gfo/Idh/MocA family oxidoreductase [Planctomycetota bacterium]
MSGGGKVRVGVVGVGHFGRNHARIYSQMEDAELVAIADPNEERREAMCELYGCRGVGDHTELEGIDAVSVAVPTVHHERVATHFLTKGIPVLVEKPIADSVDAAERIVATARENGTFVGVGHVERFNPVVDAAVKLGIRPLFIECHRLNPFSFRATDVGVVLDLMIHDLDVILHFVGSKVKTVDAVGVGVLSQHEDIANARLKFENGAVVNVTASRVAVKPMRKIRVFSPESYISLDYGRREGVIYRKSPKLTLDLVKQITEDPDSLADLRGQESVFGELLHQETLPLEERDALEMELGNFVAAVRSGGSPAVTGEHGLEVVRIAHAILDEIRAARAAAGQ